MKEIHCLGFILLDTYCIRIHNNLEKSANKLKEVDELKEKLKKDPGFHTKER